MRGSNAISENLRFQLSLLRLTAATENPERARTALAQTAESEQLQNLVALLPTRPKRRNAPNQEQN